jgi:hypothetical protein
MVHRGAGKYYAPNECAGIAVITIVVQWCALQKFVKRSAEYGHRPCRCLCGTSYSLDLFFCDGPSWSCVISLSRTFFLVRPIPAMSGQPHNPKSGYSTLLIGY